MSQTSDEMRAALWATLATAVRGAKGLGHPESAQTYERAYEVCQETPDSPYTFPLLFGLWQIHWAQGDLTQAKGESERAIHSVNAQR